MKKIITRITRYENSTLTISTPNWSNPHTIDQVKGTLKESITKGSQYTFEGEDPVETTRKSRIDSFSLMFSCDENTKTDLQEASISQATCDFELIDGMKPNWKGTCLVKIASTTPMVTVELTDLTVI